MFLVKHINGNRISVLTEKGLCMRPYVTAHKIRLRKKLRLKSWHTDSRHCDYTSVVSQWHGFKGRRVQCVPVTDRRKLLEQKCTRKCSIVWWNVYDTMRIDWDRFDTTVFNNKVYLSNKKCSDRRHTGKVGHRTTDVHVCTWPRHTLSIRTPLTNWRNYVMTFLVDSELRFTSHNIIINSYVTNHVYQTYTKAISRARTYLSLIHIFVNLS